MKEQVWNDFFTTSWVAENGLARLVHKDKEFQLEDFPVYDQMGLETARNDNGILFLAYFLALSHLCSLKDKIYQKRADIGTTIERLVRLPYRGIFNRQPAGDKPPHKAEAHDNYVGICFISRMLGLGYEAHIVSYGIKHGWNFNNINPNVFDIKFQRQPGETAFYLICNKMRPDIIGFIHLLIGIIINAFKKNPGQNNLTWLRLYTLSMISDEQGIFIKYCVLFVTLFWGIMMMFRWNSFEEMFTAYFGKNHPISKMSSHLPQGHWVL